MSGMQKRDEAAIQSTQETSGDGVMTFIEDVAEALKTVPDVTNVGICFPIDGPDQRTILANIGDDLYVIDISKVTPV